MCKIDKHNGYTYIVGTAIVFGSRMMSHDASITPLQQGLSAALSACSHDAHMMQAGLKEMSHKKQAQMDLKLSSEP